MNFVINTWIPTAVRIMSQCAKDFKSHQESSDASKMEFTLTISTQWRSTAMNGEIFFNSIELLPIENLSLYDTVNSKCGHGSRLECETDACLVDDQVIDGINRDASRLGWKAANYSEFYGRKLSEGLRYRLGTFEPRLPVKRMTKISPGSDYFPKHFNSLIEWAGDISAIRDQGWCGWEQAK